jgi:hypothetical protein
MNLTKRDELVGGQQITLIITGAIKGEGVKLSKVVPAVHQAAWASATRVEPSRDDVPTTARPLALNAQQTRPEIQNQVVPFVIERSCDTETQFECARSDLGLRERSFLIGRQHGQHVAHVTGRTVAAKGNVSV